MTRIRLHSFSASAAILVFERLFAT
jgi:hypothetical protein